MSPGASPPARFYHKMVYDSTRGFTTLFGGCSAVDGSFSCTTFRGDTWEYDGATWVQRSPAASPPARWWHAMAFDAARNVAFLHGGWDGSGNCDGSGTSNCGTVWEWNGTNWATRTPSDPENDGSLAEETRHAAAYDPARARTVVYVGSGETWEWNSSTPTWISNGPADIAQDGDPGTRTDPAMAYERDRGVSVLFGGYNGIGLSDTWEFNGNDWTQCVDFGVFCAYTDPEGDGKPASRFGHRLAYESGGDVLLFGGYSTLAVNCDGSGNRFCGTAWLWNGTSWRKCSAGAATCNLTDPEGDGNPSPRKDTALSYDDDRVRTVLFGGELSGSVLNAETWEWISANKSWDRIVTAQSPSARYGAAMAYDTYRNFTVLFGGCTAQSGSTCTAYSGETWEYNGTNWALVTPTDPEGDGNPEPRALHTLAFDQLRRRVILYGGGDGHDFGDLWEWNGTSWAKRDAGDPDGDGTPAPRDHHAMVWDLGRNTAYVYGGHTGQYTGDTWEWHTPYDTRPAHVFKTAFAAAAAPGTPAFQQVDAMFVAGGLGYSGITASNGFYIWVWEEGRWRSKVVNGSAPPSTPASLSWSTSDSALINRLFHGNEKYLNLAVTPRNNNSRGANIGEISVDYVEVKVKYRQP
ncbi:MAG: hypothetical protein HY897_05200 [Deltaproteobacteria bacterium]|nr:hypothetical protein [Deltaproteobacteria bacterium]